MLITLSKLKVSGARAPLGPTVDTPLYQNMVKNFAGIVLTQRLYPSTSKIQLALMWSYHQMTGYALTVITHTVASLSQ